MRRAGDHGGGVDLVARVVVGVELAKAEDAAFGAGGDFDDFAFGVGGADGFGGGPEVKAVDGLVVLAHVVVALGGAGVVVEGDARADDVDEGGALVGDGALYQRDGLVVGGAGGAGGGG